MADAFDDYALSLTPWMYLRLEDTSGTSATDASGNSQTGTYTNSPTLNQAPISFDQTGRSVLFNGASQYITVPHHANFDASAFTVAALIQLSTLPASYACLFNSGDNTVGGSQGYYIHCDSAGKITFATFASSSWRFASTTNAMLAAKRAYLFALTYTNSAVSFYRNGALFEQVDWSAWGAKSTSGTQPFRIGVLKDSSLTGYFPGNISRVLFFNSALTGTQIKTLFETMIVSYRGTPLDVGKPLVKLSFTKWGH